MRNLAALLLTAIVLWPVQARCDDASAAQAVASFRDGLADYRAGRFQEALAAFEASQRFKPSGGALRKVAACRERTGDLAGARKALTEYLAAPDAPDRDAVAAALARIEASLAALAPAASAPAPSGPARDQPTPRIYHQPVTAVPAGQPLSVRARIVSSSGRPILEPALVVRLAGVPAFTRVAMKPEANAKDFYVAEIPGSLVAGGLDYYLEASEQGGAAPARMGSADSPIHVAVGAPARGSD